MLDPWKRVYATRYLLGCDPEFFIARASGIIGAERVLPEAGLPAEKWTDADWKPIPGVKNERAVVLDGVQAELNPSPHFCRENLGKEISAAFRALKAHLAGLGDKDFSVSFRSVIEVDRRELDGLSEKAKQLGCAPSRNLYDKRASVKVDAASSRKRSAGGHIHIGLTPGSPKNPLADDPVKLVPLLDTVVGNTCVLIDRDPDAAERRKLYGRAGEYRLPSHGLEYRTLSNFWLYAYPLMSLVLGLTRMSLSIAAQKYRPTGSGVYGWDAESELMQRVDIEAVQRAINENDLELATRNFSVVKDFFEAHVPFQFSGLDGSRMEAFEFFTRRIHEKGLEYWFPENPLEHWVNLPDGVRSGWESFLQSAVVPEMKAGVV
jgi:hypothetical protein